MRCEYCGAAGTMAQEKCWRCGTPLAPARLPRIRMVGHGAPSFPASQPVRLRTMEGFPLPGNSLPVALPATDTAARPKLAAPPPSRRTLPDLALISDTLATATSISAPPRARSKAPWRIALGTCLLAAGVVLGGAGGRWLYDAERGMEGMRPAVGMLAAPAPTISGSHPGVPVARPLSCRAFSCRAIGQRSIVQRPSDRRTTVRWAVASSRIFRAF